MSAHMGRRLGLNKFQRPPPLLKNLPSGASQEEPSPDTKTRAQSSRTRTSAKTETAKMAPRTGARNKPDRQVADDAPPLPTDDESEDSEDQASQGSNAHLQDSIVDSSEDGLADRVDIKRTQFGAPDQNGGQARLGTGRQTGQGKLAKDNLKAPRSTSSRRKRKVDDEPDENEEPFSRIQSGSPDHDQASRLKPRRPMKTYKGRKRIPAAPSTQDVQSSDESASRAPVKLRPVPAANISPVKASTFVAPDDNPFSSPRTPRAKQVKLKGLDLPGLDDSDVIPAKKPKAKPKPGPKKIRVPGAKRGKGKKTDDAAEPSDLEDSFALAFPTKKFVAPAAFSQLDTNSTSAVLDPLDSDDSDTLSEPPLVLDDPFEEEEEDPTTPCPWCQAPVEKALLEAFAKGKRLNVRMQARFCQSHKKQTALETWRERRYPEVDWEGLEARFAAHRARLLGIINGGESHYRGRLAARIEAGRARDMKKEENLNPGYYGPRGLNVMCDYMVGEFGDLLKQRAVRDRVIAGRGSAAFIQSVLVAELAVLLIAEDLGVSAEEAREIMEESKALGDMVHEEV